MAVSPFPLFSVLRAEAKRAAYFHGKTLKEFFATQYRICVTAIKIHP